MRAAGVEVWFDQNELVGGDAWDAKIRKQIAECALFMPVISANTQARLEGYFRIEWRLAAQRTHAMADGTPFVFPVVIDATREAEAKVPVEFKAVQWTRLRPAYGGQALDDPSVTVFCARVGKLLGDSAMDPEHLRPAQRDEVVASPAPALNRVGRRVPAAAWGVVAAFAVALAAGGYIWLKRPPEAVPFSAQHAGAGARPPTAEKSAPG